MTQAQRTGVQQKQRWSQRGSGDCKMQRLYWRLHEPDTLSLSAHQQMLRECLMHGCCRRALAVGLQLARARLKPRPSQTAHPLTAPSLPPRAPTNPHQQWDKVENKTGVVIYGAGAVVLLWLSSTIVGAIDHVPLVSIRFCTRSQGLPSAHRGLAVGAMHALQPHGFQPRRFSLATAPSAHPYSPLKPPPPRPPPPPPQIPKLFELVGLGYTAWFVYRYLLFKDSREELVKDVDSLKKKITGGEL